MNTIFRFLFILLLVALSMQQQTTRGIKIPLKKKKRFDFKQSILKKFPTKKNLISMNVLNYFNDQYTATFTIGRNKQEVNLLLDTGSAWLWVADKSSGFGNSFTCEKDDGCDADKTSIHRISYGQGKGVGYKIKDYLNIDDSKSINTDIILATSISDLGTFYADGILGLGLKTPDGRKNPFLLNAYEENVIDVLSFSMYISNDPSSFGEPTGQFQLGGYDQELLKENFTFLDVDKNENYWAVSLNGIAVGSQHLNLPTNYKAVIDSGTSLITLPTKLFEEYFKEIHTLTNGACTINEDNLIVCPCHQNIPDLHIYFNGYHATIAKDLLLGRHSDTCIILIHGLDHHNYILLGDVFMRKYYSYFTLSNSTIGIAEAIQIVPSHPIRTFLIGFSILLSGLMVYLPLRNFIKVVKGRKSHYQDLKCLSERILTRRKGANSSMYRNGVKMSMETTEVVNRTSGWSTYNSSSPSDSVDELHMT